MEKMIKMTNKNSADVFINAEELIQNLKSKNINQYIEAGSVTQTIDITDGSKLKQILMNTDLFQTINYITRETIVKNINKYIVSD